MLWPNQRFKVWGPLGFLWRKIVGDNQIRAHRLSSLFVDYARTPAAAWVVADSYCGMPWLAVGKRERAADTLLT